MTHWIGAARPRSTAASGGCFHQSGASTNGGRSEWGGPGVGIPTTAPLTPGAGLFSGEGVGGGLPHALVVAASLVTTHEPRGAAPPLQVAVTTSLVSRGGQVWGQDRPVGSRCSGGIPSCDSPPSLPAPSLPTEVDGGPERGCADPRVVCTTPVVFAFLAGRPGAGFPCIQNLLRRGEPCSPEE